MGTLTDRDRKHQVERIQCDPHHADSALRIVVLRDGVWAAGTELGRVGFDVIQVQPRPGRLRLWI